MKVLMKQWNKKTAVVGLNDVVVVSGKKKSSTSSNYYNYEKEEIGLIDDKVYVFEENTSNKTDLERTAQVFTVVDDAQENLLASQVKESDAKLAVTTSGFIDRLLSAVFSNSTNSFVTTDSYGWKEIAVSSQKSEDGKSYTSTATAYYSSYKRFITLTSVIDGDNFLKNVQITFKDYNSSDVEEITEGEEGQEVTTHAPVEGAEPKSEKHINIAFERDYRSPLNKTDVKAYASNDYDVVVSYKIPGDYTTYTTGSDHLVYKSAALSFDFDYKENAPIIILPTCIGAKEDGFITFEDDKTVVANVGDFTLQFDNGFGVIKEVSMKSELPPAKSMTVSLSSSVIYNGESSVLTAAITPSGADQSVKVEVKEGSTANAEITKNEDGTYSIKGTQNGEGTLVVTSLTNASITKEIAFTVKNKPTAASIRAFLTTTTLHGSVRYYGSHYVNFNADGTGEWVCYEDGKGNVIEFQWELDESTFEITISGDGLTGTSCGYKMVGFKNTSDDSVIFVFSYYGDNKEATMTATDSKLDLKTAELTK